MPDKILIIEDEQKLAQILSDYLKQAGYETDCLYTGQDAVAVIREQRPALILLDLMLPGRDGLDICREVRTFSNLPIIMITARVEEIDRILGLELGADDYICKPFSPREVVARVKTVLRRAAGTNIIATADLSLDAGRYLAALEGKDLNLTAIEFKLLQFLANHPGQIFGRQVLMDRIYQDERIVSDRTIDSHIKKLRKKISGLCPHLQLIHSVYGVGYKFEYEKIEGL